MENLVIIGSGPAALTAGIYSSRALLNPLIIEGSTPGGQLIGTSFVENWPGEISILGHELVKNIRNHAEYFGTRFLQDEITEVDFSNKSPFKLKTKFNKIIESKAVIIATGATSKKLGCEGEELYWSKGVTTCAVCDGFFYKNKPVVIVGGGDSAMENALFMSKFTNQITIVHILKELTASPIMKQRVLAHENIKIIYESTVTKILGNNNNVESVEITNNNTKLISYLNTNAVFVSIGLLPNTKIFQNQLELNNYGYILLKNRTETSVPGVFAAGDVVDNIYRQAITSAGSGCKAALDAEKFLSDFSNSKNDSKSPNVSSKLF